MDSFDDYKTVKIKSKNIEKEDCDDACCCENVKKECDYQSEHNYRLNGKDYGCGSDESSEIYGFKHNQKKILIFYINCSWNDKYIETTESIIESSGIKKFTNDYITLPTFGETRIETLYI